MKSGIAMMLGMALLCCGGSAGRAPRAVGSGPGGERALAAEEGARFDSVVIDAGHGGEDRGARGVRGLLEKDLVLDIARRVAVRLRDRGVRVVMTRDRDVFVPLETRTAIANDARADLFVSIHANSARSPKPRGVEAYFASLEATDAGALAVAERENLAFNESGVPAAPADPLVAIIGDMIAADQMRESDAFARLVQAELDAIERVASRGVKQAPFVVLLGVQMPSSLIEIGFLSNPEEERRLRSDSRREAVAAALERAVVAYARRYDAVRGLSGRGG